MGEYAYLLPTENTHIAAQLIDSVPNDWSWCTGQLDAPLADTAEGKVVEAGYLFDRMSHFGNIKVVTLLDAQNRDNPANESLLKERRDRAAKLLSGLFMPGYVSFVQAAFDCGEWGLVPLHTIKEIAQGYVLRNYKGDLSFYSDCYDDKGHQNPAKIELHLSNWREYFPRHEAMSKMEYIDGQPIFDTPRVEHPPLIKLTYDEKFKGHVGLLASLLRTCNDAGLQELDPSAIGPGASHSQQLY